jgi:hypothetical protein
MTTNAKPKTAARFLEFSFQKLIEQYWPPLQTCVEALTDEQVWWRPNDSSNSIGNLTTADGKLHQQKQIPEDPKLACKRRATSSVGRRGPVVFVNTQKELGRMPGLSQIA